MSTVLLIMISMAFTLCMILCKLCKKQKPKPKGEKYFVRKGEELDSADINEICQDVYYKSDFVHTGWYRFIQDPDIHVYVTVHEQSNKVVSVSMSKVHDSGLKGTIFGSRTHIDHRRKGLITKLTTFMKQQVELLHPDLIAWESTLYSSNSSSIKLQTKRGLTVVGNVKYKFIAITKLDLKDSKYYVNMKYDEFKPRWKELLTEKQNFKCIYSYLSDAAKMTEFLVDKYELSLIYYDWKIYKIENIKCREGNQRFLQKEMDEKRLYCIMNEDKNVMCLVNLDEKPMVQLHFYHDSELQVDTLLMMINELYEKWVQENSDLFGKMQHMRIFINDDYVNNDEKLRILCDGFDTVYVCNSYPNYYQ